MGQYEELFGGPPATKFNITPSDDAPASFDLKFNDATRYLMYYSMRLFYNNGGADCYIVSVGTYSDKIEASKLNDPKGDGLSSLEKHLEPTIVVVPDAILLSPNDCLSLQAAILSHCGYKMKNRFALLDVIDGDKERTFDDEDVINKFREGIGSNFLQWGAAYYPYLNTTILSVSDIDFTFALVLAYTTTSLSLLSLQNFLN